MNVLLWYRLGGGYVGLLFEAHALEVSACAWYGDDSPHLAGGPSSHRVKVHLQVSSLAAGKQAC